ncbi:MAG: nuclear transport factor 2 family protein [Gammaproteobacteria bacterium]
MAHPEWIIDLFKSIDRKDADGFVSFLTEEATFRLGNTPPVTGRESIRKAVSPFFSSIQALEHGLIDTWVLQHAVICIGEAKYTRHDGSVLAVPFANVLKLNNSLVHEYLVYVDISQLFSA